MAAEEAKELCVPIITLGKGCLSERVEDGKTGFIAKDEKEICKYTLELFANDSFVEEMRNNLINIRGKKKLVKSCRKSYSKNMKKNNRTLLKSIKKDIFKGFKDFLVLLYRY